MRNGRYQKLDDGAAAYLALLRYALWGGAFPALPEDLSAIQALAARQSTRGLIFDALLRGNVPLSREEAARMQHFLLQGYASNGQLDSIIQRIFPALRQAGIPAVLIKGQGVARNYPDPRLRENGDIDIYIGPKRVEDAVRTLTPFAESVDEEAFGKHWQLYIDGREIELHYTTVEIGTFRRRRLYDKLQAEGFGHGLVPVEIGSVQVDTPEATFNAFYLFYHLWHHFTGTGVGFRQVCDWTLYLHARQADIDRERLHRMLKGMRLLVPWQVLGCVVVHELGLPEAEFPLYDEAAYARSRELLALILEDGNFGKARKRRKRPAGYLAGKWSAFLYRTRRIRQLWHIYPREALHTLWEVIRKGFLNISRDQIARLSRKS